jgi:hypothetical protein
MGAPNDSDLIRQLIAQGVCDSLGRPLTPNLGVTAVNASASGTQAGGTALKFGVNVVTGGAGPGYSVTLPHASGSGGVAIIIVRGAWFVSLFTPVGEQMNIFGANVGYASFPAATLLFVDSAVGQWDFVANLPFYYPIYTGLVAHAGGGQAAAVQLGYGTNWIQTCASAGDSVKLPISTGGCEGIWITNDGVQSLNVFPQVGARINLLAIDAAIAVPSGTSLLLNDIGPPNKWVSR